MHGALWAGFPVVWAVWVCAWSGWRLDDGMAQGWCMRNLILSDEVIVVQWLGIRI